MPILSFGDKSYTVNHAVKGADYIHGYNADGTLLIAFDGVSDFSGFSYDGTYMDPTECATEGCNGTILVGGALKTRDGRNVTPAQIGAAPAGSVWTATDPNNDGNIVLQYGGIVEDGGTGGTGGTVPGGGSSGGGLTAKEVQAMIDAALAAEDELTEEEVQSMIDASLGVIENGTY